jgi:hypothetical protein
MRITPARRDPGREQPDGDHRNRPHDGTRAPAAAHRRKHDGNGERCVDRFAHEERSNRSQCPATRRGTQSRTTAGSAGCMIAMPTPMTNVIEQHRDVVGDFTSPEARPQSRMPPVSTCAAPKRDTSSEPGRAANETAVPAMVRAPTADCEISKPVDQRMTGGIASTVMRSAMPNTHSRTSALSSLTPRDRAAPWDRCSSSPACRDRGSGRCAR